jgi:hypothetical protein
MRAHSGAARIVPDWRAMTRLAIEIGARGQVGENGGEGSSGRVSDCVHPGPSPCTLLAPPAVKMPVCEHNLQRSVWPLV